MSVEIEIETDEDYLQKQVEAELAEMSDGDDEDVGDWSINWKQRNAEPVPEDGDVSFQEEDEDMREFLESSSEMLIGLLRLRWPLGRVLQVQILSLKNLPKLFIQLELI